MQEGIFGGLQFCETYFIRAMLSSIFIQYIEVLLVVPKGIMNLYKIRHWEHMGPSYIYIF
jgi:hypothetical protein